MDTPRKNLYYNSPYARSIKQYPSQSEDYISLDMGGSKQSTPMGSSNEKTPGHYNPKYYQQNIRNSNTKSNKKNLFNNYCQQNQRQSFNQQRYGQRRSGEWCQQQNNRNNNDKRSQHQQQNDKKDCQPISSFIHPSMTEDPWFELTKRLKSLANSQISTKESSPPSIASSNANSDDDKEIEESATSD